MAALDEHDGKCPSCFETTDPSDDEPDAPSQDSPSEAPSSKDPPSQEQERSHHDSISRLPSCPIATD
jgi:hypothetical protein